ncbi:MAG: hypothetical protein JW818_07040 [Pirellulales bacterium]|nr:hypothetical protein [Pirellulales bacterium]
MRTFQQALTAVAGLVLAASVGAAREPSQVDDYGNRERLVFEGCRAFPSERVKGALVNDIDVLLAAHPAAPLETYRTTLQERLTAGYQHAGFRDVRVAARIDRKAEKVRITVEEGPRFTAGKVVVRGRKKVDADTLIKWHTSPCPPAGARLDGVVKRHGETIPVWVDREDKKVDPEEPLWNSGKPVPFDAATLDRLRRRTARGLADQGYFSPSFDVSTDVDQGKATLVIHLNDEGPKAVLGEVTIQGNERNTRDEILNRLKLKPGMELTADWRAALQYRLWRSGRFVKGEVELLPPKKGNNRIGLKLTLVENPWSPRLSEPLSREQKILLKCRDQLAQPDRWPGDLVVDVDVPGMKLHGVASSTQGFIGRLVQQAASNRNRAGSVDIAMLLSSKQQGLFCNSPVTMKLLTESVKPLEKEIVATIGLYLIPDLDSEQTQRFSLGCWIAGRKKGLSLPIRFSVTVSPAFFIAQPTVVKGSHSTIKDGVLTVVHPERSVLRVDVATGRLLEMVFQKEPGAKDGMRFHFQKGAFESCRKEVMASGADAPNRFDKNAPLSSVLAILGDEKLVGAVTDVRPERLRWIRFIRKMHEKHAFDSLNDLAKLGGFEDTPEISEDRRFGIPASLEVERKFKHSWGKFFSLSRGLPAADLLFPRRSWPWTAMREVALTAAGEAKYTQVELARLWESDEAGPIFHLAAAVGLERVNAPLAGAFADRGLQKLSTAHFQNDCRVLLDDRCILGQCVRAMAKTIRELDPKEVDTILGNRRPGESSPLAELIQAIRSQPDKTVEDVLLDALTKAWKTGLRDQVEAQLKAIRDRQMRYAMAQ